MKDSRIISHIYIAGILISERGTVGLWFLAILWTVISVVEKFEKNTSK